MLFGPSDSVEMKSGRRVQMHATNACVLPPQCSGCQKPIRERFLLKALEQLWHEDCLKCACCDCRLGEVGSTLFTKANLILCKRDYLRLFGSTGLCAACHKNIAAFEMVMRARGNVYHLECFACHRCNHRFCVGDRFYMRDNRILCEYDYSSSGGGAIRVGAPPTPPMIPPPNTRQPPLQQPPINHPLQQKPIRGVEMVPNVMVGGVVRGDDASSGYGSPDSALSDHGGGK